MVISKYH